MTKARRRRFRGQRTAVSPIIATILLVAIAVVLAAVTYVLVTHEVHGVGAVPLGYEFYAGPASPGTVGTAATNAFCAKSHYCYSIPIDEAGGDLDLSDVNFKVLEATGSPHVVSKNFAQLSIVNLKNSVIALTKISKNVAFVVTQWQTFGAGVSGSTPLSDQQMIWLQFGNTAQSPFGQGDMLEVLGVGSFTGSLEVALP